MKDWTEAFMDSVVITGCDMRRAEVWMSFSETLQGDLRCKKSGRGRYCFWLLPPIRRVRLGVQDASLSRW